MSDDTQELVSLVQRYFAAVDNEDLEDLLKTLAPDCVFRVETHGVELFGHDHIAEMFRGLWTGHKAVLHHEFRHIPDPKQGRIASQFKVVNTLQDGSLVHKSNCNFFTIKDRQISAVSVYMAGKNTLF